MGVEYNRKLPHMSKSLVSWPTCLIWRSYMTIWYPSKHDPLESSTSRVPPVPVNHYHHQCMQQSHLGWQQLAMYGIWNILMFVVDEWIQPVGTSRYPGKASCCFGKQNQSKLDIFLQKIFRLEAKEESCSREVWSQILSPLIFLNWSRLVGRLWRGIVWNSPMHREVNAICSVRWKIEVLMIFCYLWHPIENFSVDLQRRWIGRRWR